LLVWHSATKRGELEERVAPSPSAVGKRAGGTRVLN
jgi:hypothetical protein